MPLQKNTSAGSTTLTNCTPSEGTQRWRQSDTGNTTDLTLKPKERSTQKPTKNHPRKRLHLMTQTTYQPLRHMHRRRTAEYASAESASAITRQHAPHLLQAPPRARSLSHQRRLMIEEDRANNDRNPHSRQLKLRWAPHTLTPSIFHSKWSNMTR